MPTAGIQFNLLRPVASAADLSHWIITGSP
jgi:hypothetical protein